MEETTWAAWVIIVGLARIASLVLRIIQMKQKKEMDVA